MIIFASHDASAKLPILDMSGEGIFGAMNWQPDALNSDSEAIGNYEVVVATDTFSPTIGQTVHIQFKVYNYNQGYYRDKLNYAEMGVNHFTMGVRVYHNDVLMHEFLPQYHDGSSWSTNYTFTKSGNYVLRVDLYDFDKNNNVVTYIFNIPVSTEFGPIFQYIIIAAAAAFATVLVWVKLTMMKKSQQR
ncbi:MAG: hypothetical protein PXX83_03550 [Candidatus Nitrosotalea sp.]|nr:hypothetical protein [Candidatus Nitrosotalea sp.]